MYLSYIYSHKKEIIYFIRVFISIVIATGLTKFIPDRFSKLLGCLLILVMVATAIFNFSFYAYKS